MDEKREKCECPGGVREFPAETLCPSCGKFVGAYEKCPYCGTGLTKRMSIRFFKRCALVLAFGGLFLLWFTATKMQPPHIHVSDINARYNNAVVELQGKVTGAPRMKGKDDVSFMLDDGTGEIKVQSFRGREEMRRLGNLPYAGDQVTVVGAVQTTDRYGTSLMINIPSKVKVSASPVEKVRIGEITLEDKNKLVEITAEIVSSRENRGNVFLVVGDRTGTIDMPLWKSDLGRVKDRASVTAVGRELKIVGNVGEYRGKPQIQIRDIDRLEALAGDTIPTNEIAGREEAQAKEREVFEKMSPNMKATEEESAEQPSTTY